MTKQFSLQLAERVLTTFLFAFFAAWAVGIGTNPTLHQIGDLSVAQKAAAAGGAAVVQLLLGVFVAPHVGDPNSPALLPSRWTGKIHATVAQKQSIVVSVDDVVSAVGRNLAKRLAPGNNFTVMHDDIVDVILRKMEQGAPVVVEQVANDLIDQLVAAHPVVLPHPA